MTRSGMDVDIVTQHGTSLKTIGENEIQSTISRINGIISEIQSNWWGPDAQQFHSRWTGTDQPALTLIGHNLAAYGQSAITNAQAQANTSTAGGV
jgi:uncharacterized protein YukE